MSGKINLGITILVGSFLFAGCTQNTVEQLATDSKLEAPKSEMTIEPEDVKVYDLVKEDVTQIPDLTSRNLSVMGVKLGDPTSEVNQNKRLGKVLETTPLGALYRSAYQERGIYLDFDKQTGKVIAIYVNTSLAKKVKGQSQSDQTKAQNK